MSQYLVGALLTAAAMLSAAGFTAWRDQLTRASEARERQQTALRRAMADYLVALDQLVMELRSTPQPEEPGWSQRALTRLNGLCERVLFAVGLGIFVLWLNRISIRGAYGTRFQKLIDSALRADAQLRLLAPPLILEHMNHVDRFLGERRGRRGDDWVPAWRALRGETEHLFREVCADPPAARVLAEAREFSEQRPVLSRHSG